MDSTQVVTNEQQGNTQVTPQPEKQPEKQSEQAPTEPQPWEQEKQQLSGKIQKLQTDLNRVTNGTSLEDAEYFIKTGVTMENLATQNPEFKDRVLELVEKAKTGTLTKKEEAELDKKTEQLQKDEPKPTSSADPEKQWIRSRMQEEQAQREKFFAELEGEEREEINQESYFDQSSGRVRNLTREAIAVNAQRFMKVNKLSEQEAYKKAYMLVRHPEKLKEEGEVEGMAKALSTATTTGNVSGGTITKDSPVNVPDSLREGYEYRLRKYGKERADAYVKSVTGKK